MIKNAFFKWNRFKCGKNTRVKLPFWKETNKKFWIQRNAPRDIQAISPPSLLSSLRVDVIEANRIPCSAAATPATRIALFSFPVITVRSPSRALWDVPQRIRLTWVNNITLSREQNSAPRIFPILSLCRPSIALRTCNMYKEVLNSPNYFYTVFQVHQNENEDIKNMKL